MPKMPPVAALFTSSSVPRMPFFSIASLFIRGLDALALSPSSPQVDAVVRADNGANKKTGIDYRSSGEVTFSYSS
ncbi:hypothetical protein E2562_016034 [Oryza meyeriana var. granulata]|uniref:Uncharacterized protein n=1 Tax=Oryza meyeriana var. granulata TaxID=110450 RepID=A0A6G1EM34_9ORYZ|nr:hypothetical protein E2562_016034 [Oryza meyeriana var. granulata]